MELAFLISFTDLSLVAEIGITTPGNKTAFLSGRIGTDSGGDSLRIASSSSDVINGINSDSSSTGPKLLLKSKKFAIIMPTCQYMYNKFIYICKFQDSCQLNKVDTIYFSFLYLAEGLHPK